VRNHQLQIFADAICRWRATVFRAATYRTSPRPASISAPKTVAADFLRDADQQKVKGYDHAFLLQAKGDARKPRPTSGRRMVKLQMTVYTSAPALQFTRVTTGGTPSRTEQPYADWQVWRWRANFCRIHQIIRNGRSRTASCARARSTSA
jgi:aldose 1-epimerase